MISSVNERHGRLKCNLISFLRNRENGDKGCPKSGLHQMPKSMLSRLSRENDRIPECVISLRDSLASRDFSACMTAVRHAAMELADHTGPLEQREGVTPNSPQRDCFLLFGGPHVLTRILQVPVDGEPDRAVMGWRGHGNDANSWELRRECMQLLRELCYSTPPLSEQLCSNDRLLVFLFHLMRHHATFDEAISLTEEVLAFRAEVFSLVSVPDIEGLVAGLSKRKLAFFCRVLALLVFESDEKAAAGTASGGGGGGGEDVKIATARDLLASRREQALSPSVKNTDRNHAVLLGMRVLLPRLVQLLAAPSPPGPPRMSEEGLAHLQLHHHDVYALLDDGDDAWDDEVPPAAAAGAAAGAPRPAAAQHPHPGLLPPLPPAPAAAGGTGVGGHEAMRDLALLTHQVEVLFVLCTLLAGKRKAEVQERLASLGAIPLLQRMFDRMDWRKAPSAPLERLHGPGCECNPESALRIQLLRLLHNLCDREFDHLGLKHRLVSPHELASASPCPAHDALRLFLLLPAQPPAHAAHAAPAQPAPARAEEGAGAGAGAEEEEGGEGEGGAGGALDHYSMRYPESDPPSPIPAPPPAAPPHPAATSGVVVMASRRTGACLSTRRAQAGGAGGRGGGKAEGAGGAEAERGLMTRILQVFMGEAPDSAYRFWLASCLESFLRGADYRAQVILARAGLLEHLVRGVHSGQCSGSLQTNFDLLGELVKCNATVFAMLNRLLDHKTYSAFMQVVVSNLVDSNVFIRAIVLSLEFFSAKSHALQEAGQGYDVEGCKIRAFLRVNALRLVRDLMTVVTVEDVNQENICCLNTALSLFIFADARGALERDVAALRRWELRNPHARSVTGNFLALLRFWTEYYVYRGKDCLSLEFSSSIHFSRWRATVAALTALLAPFHPDPLPASAPTASPAASPAPASPPPPTAPIHA